MHAESDSLRSLGFRHVVEDAVAVLRGQTLPADRRTYVLHDLSKIVSDAKAFSGASPANFASSANRQAYAFYTLLSVDHKIDGRPWQHFLGASAIVLKKLARGQAGIDEHQRKETILFLEDLLACLSTGPRPRLFRRHGKESLGRRP